MRKFYQNRNVILWSAVCACVALSLVLSSCQNEETSPEKLVKSRYDTSPSKSQEIEYNMTDTQCGIEIDSISDCLNMGIEADIIDIPFNLDCIKWGYTSDKKLHFHHANAGFNCCPELDKTIEIHADTIVITEIELSGDCDCLCLFDLYYTISNLRVGVYHIKVIEPYVEERDEPLEFTIDLRHNNDGDFCLEREYYPWGE